MTEVMRGVKREPKTEPRTTTRWEEAKENIALAAELATCFDTDGVDVRFLNQQAICNVQGIDSPEFGQAFQSEARGSTPLYQALTDVLNDQREKTSTKPLLLMIATDGRPTDSESGFKTALFDALDNGITTTDKNGNTSNRSVHVGIIACTDEKGVMNWLNGLDKAHAKLDVIDDFASEAREIRRNGRQQFTKGDYVAKMLLGPIDPEMDTMDEGSRSRFFNKFLRGGPSSATT